MSTHLRQGIGDWACGWLLGFEAAAMKRDAIDCVVSVSGMRGIVGAGIHPQLVTEMAMAYGSSIAKGGAVILGRDSRPTGAMFARAVASGLQAVGCDVIDIGVVPTPTVPIMIDELAAAGGIQISASHNPVEWNALKFFNGKARNIDKQELEALLCAYEAESRCLPWDRLGSYLENTQALEIHKQKVIELVDADVISQARPKILIDSVNGAGSNIAPDLLRSLGCEVIELYTNPNQVFPRDPEPTASNVTETGAQVKASGAALGFVQDPDADRLAIIDENGRYIGEEYTLVLCAAARLAQLQAAGITDAVVCTNLSTSRMLEDVAARYGAQVKRSAVGEANVVDAMESFHAVMGGEGNGGIIDPRVVFGRDSQIGMALVVEYLVRSGKKFSELLADIPAYGMHKEKVAMDRATVTAQIPTIKAHFADATFDEQDGLKCIWPDRWLHIRASGTEPASRIIAEAPTLTEAQLIAQECRDLLGAELIIGH